MSLEYDKNIIKKFNLDFQNEKKFSDFIDNIINGEFDLYFEDILNDDNFILNINNGIKIQLTHLYNDEIFDNNSLNSLLNKKNIEIEKNYKNYFNLLNETYLNANKRRNKNNDKFFLINTFRKHCCKTEDICRHNCSNDSQFIICSLTVNNNNSNNNSSNNNNKIYLICNLCKKVYLSKYILAYCNDCECEYFTSILFTNKTVFPATWKEYHCEQIRNEKMKCLQCKEILYLNLNTHVLQCLNKNCLCEFDPLKIEWKCNICKTNFISDAIVYNPLEIEIVKRIISQTLLLKHKAHPNRLPCCNLNIFFTDFYHKKDCNGVLYVGELKNKVIIVCEKCKAINFYDRFIWTCPKCGTRFRDKKGIKKEKNDKLLLKPSKNEEKNNFSLIQNKNENKTKEETRKENNNRRINKSVNKENNQNNNIKRNENYILEQRKKNNLTEVDLLNMSEMNIHKFKKNTNEENNNEIGRRKFSDKEKQANVVIKGRYSKDKNDKFIYMSPQRRKNNLFNKNNSVSTSNINNNEINRVKLKNINNSDNNKVPINNNSRNNNPKISSAKSLEKHMNIEEKKDNKNNVVNINNNNDKEIIKQLLFNSPNQNEKISEENKRFLEKIASTKNLLYDYKNFQTENSGENQMPLNKTKTLRHFKINSEYPVGILETDRKKKFNENKINNNNNNNKVEEKKSRGERYREYREKINAQKRESANNIKQNNKEEEENINNRSMMYKRNIKGNDLQNLDIKNVQEKDFDEKTMTLNRGRFRNRREKREFEEKEKKEKEKKEKEEKERLERREKRERERKEREQKEKEEREQREKYC